MQHIADYLFEVGPTSGEESLKWTEVSAWSRETGVELGDFRAVALVTLSREFLAMLHKAREENCPAPGKVELTNDDRQRMAANLQSMLRKNRG